MSKIIRITKKSTPLYVSLPYFYFLFCFILYFCCFLSFCNCKLQFFQLFYPKGLFFHNLFSIMKIESFNSRKVCKKYTKEQYYDHWTKDNSTTKQYGYFSRKARRASRCFPSVSFKVGDGSHYPTDRQNTPDSQYFFNHSFLSPVLPLRNSSYKIIE